MILMNNKRLKQILSMNEETWSNYIMKMSHNF